LDRARVFHARLVAEDRTARPARRRIDGENCHALSQTRQVLSEGFDESRLAHPWRTGDSNTDGASGSRKDREEQPLGGILVVRPG
jgi:hypothetical protein